MTRLGELRQLIADNEIRGGSAFGRAIAEVVALTVEERPFARGEAVREAALAAAAWGVATKPSMTSLRAVENLARNTLDAHPGAAPPVLVAAVAAAMRAFVARSEAAIASLADAGEPLFKPGAVVVTHSFSESLVHVLRRGARARPDLTVVLTESRPLRESRHLARALEHLPVTLKLYSDAGMALAVKSADFALIGADAILADGSFANKTGSLPLALACRYFSVPCHVAAELSKVYLGPPSDVLMEVRPDAELAGDWALAVDGRVKVVNQFFETVPAEFVAGYVTDHGLLSPAEAVAKARALSAL
jgi:translation initiation factor 2B subunit (eIF-2B alpha/beta/delta family)